MYPGTFDPITNGHTDIIRRACKLADKIVIGVAIADSKRPLFTLEEWVALVERETDYLKDEFGVEIEVLPFAGLLVQFSEEVNADFLIRGLRAVSDFEYELQMVGMNMRLNKDFEAVFLMASEKNLFIASSLVKEIAKMGGDIESFVSKNVARDLLGKFKEA